MFYVSRGNIPPTRHTQHRAPDGSLYAEELFGVEGFTGRSSLLYHLVPPTQTHKIEPGRAGHNWRRRTTAGITTGWSRPATCQARGHVAQGRYPLFFNNDVVMGVIRPADSMPPTCSTATATPTRCSSSTRAPACSRASSATSATARATTSSSPSARPTGWRRMPASTTASCTSSRRRRSSRPSATTTTTASCWSTRPTRSATSTRPTSSRPTLRRATS